MAVDHKRIRSLLGEEGPAADLSLQGKSLQRARSGKPPRTLTPHEWQQWYAEHGVPQEHLRPVSRAADGPWWRKLLRCWPGGR